jgi:antitoxin VapB
MLIAPQLATGVSPDPRPIGWTDLESGRSLLEAMTHRSDDLDLLAPDLAGASASRARRDTLVRRDQERFRCVVTATAQERIAAMRRIAARVAKLPVLDDRSPDEILGYDESGLPI